MTTQHIQIGETYKVYGTHYVRVVRITDKHIQVVHAVNGASPRRTCDRLYPISKADKFIPYRA